jgi:hypothetical protein
MTLETYGHLIEELEGQTLVSAEAAIQRAPEVRVAQT